MDDPRHLERRASDLHDFRKFARTSSFTYGETQSSHPTSRALPCPPLAFAAASAAAARRSAPVVEGHTIEEEMEDQSPCSTFAGKISGIGRRIGLVQSAIPRMGESVTDSPCPPSGQAIFGSARVRTLGRAGFTRTASEAIVTIKR